MLYATITANSCDRETTFCLMTEPEPAESASAAAISRAKYTCVCNEGFFVPNETFQGFPSEKVENDAGNFSCLPCPGGCLLCDKNGSCMFGNEEPEDFLTESVLRASIGAILGACVGCCFVLSFIVFRQRKCKVSVCPSINRARLLAQINSAPNSRPAISIFFLFSSTPMP